MMRVHLVRLCIGVLLFSLSVALLACSGNQPTRDASQTTPSAPPAYEGYLDIANCDAIIAWGWDMNHPNEPIKLDIYDGNLLVSTVTADNFRQDLLDVGKGNGKHAIFWPIPPQMKDGKKHIITVKFPGTSVELGTAPKEITCNFEQ